MKRIGEVILALASLAAAVVFLLYAVQQLKLWQNHRYISLNAEFDDSAQLSIGAEVRIAGIKVGRLVEKKLNGQKYNSLVHIEVDEQVKIPKDSLISINTGGLLAGAHLKITPGNADEYLANNDYFQHTKGAIPIEELIGRAIFALSDENAGKKPTP